MDFGTFHTEENITAALRLGNTEAFDWMYNYFYDRLYAMATRFLNDSNEARDVVSDGFLRLWTERENQQHFQAISVFLFLFVKHRCLDLLRSRKVRHEHHQHILQLLETQTQHDLTADLIRLELFKMIYAEAERLPDKMKEVFRLTYKEGLKPAQIAQQLNVNVQTVKNQRLEAIKTLKRLLASKPLLVAFLTLLEMEDKIFF